MNMTWDRAGQRVAGVYLGYTVAGLVTESRVKYGGRVQHTLQLDQPMTLFSTERSVLLMDERDLFKTGREPA
jgi:hypothetical protein